MTKKKTTKYILRYEKKSKYIGFHKIHYKEFNNLEDLIIYTLDEGITRYEVYECNE